MDVLVDAYMRTGKSYYKELFPLWWEGMPKYNFAGKMNPKDPWWNVFVDELFYRFLYRQASIYKKLHLYIMDVVGIFKKEGK